MEVITRWLSRHFSDPQVVILLAFLVGGVLLFVLAGHLLAPVLASIVIAYLLEGAVGWVTRRRMARLGAVLVVFTGFLLSLLGALFVLIPLLSRQAAQLFGEVPGMLAKGQTVLEHLPERYPSVINDAQVHQIMARIQAELTALGQTVVSHSLASLVGLITVMVYLVLMPLLVFFFLKDKNAILDWFRRFLPQDHALVSRVWHEVDIQIGNYVRGKIWEILIVWAASYAVFTLMGLQFAALLGLLVGLSVLVPYVGAAVVVFPIAAVAYFQWGFSTELAWIIAAYFIIHGIDGNILVPLLYSEVVNLHPIAIIVAIVFFGGIWGLWGVFFAIPLATLVQAVLRAWPTGDIVAAEASEDV